MRNWSHRDWIVELNGQICGAADAAAYDANAYDAAKMLTDCAEIVRKHFPKAPKL